MSMFGGRRRGPAAILLLGALAGELGLLACGVPVDRQPRPLAIEDLPPGFLAEPPTTTSTSPPVVEVRVPVFFLGGDRLVLVERRVAAPATLERSLLALLAGVNDEDAIRGLRSAVPAGTRLRSVRMEGEVARVDLSLELAQGFGAEQTTALAQIVYTATGFEGVKGVRFVIEGQEIDVPAGDGTLTASPLGRDAYPALAPA